jgi:hypothetical protein
MAEPQTKTYQKIITVNDESKQNILKCISILTECMYESSKHNKENIEYFRLRLMDSERSVNAKDLKLEWTCI